MMAAHKRATAGTVTLSKTALAGGPNINPLRMDLTMVNITARPPGATADVTLQVADIAADIVTLLVAEDRSRPLNPGEPIKFSTTLEGQPVVTRTTTPFFDSCRVLAAFGFGGKVEFVDAVTGAPRMAMMITEGAKLTAVESPTGPKVRKHVAADRAEPTASGRKVDAGAVMEEDA